VECQCQGNIIKFIIIIYRSSFLLLVELGFIWISIFFSWPLSIGSETSRKHIFKFSASYMMPLYYRNLSINIFHIFPYFAFQSIFPILGLYFGNFVKIVYFFYQNWKFFSKNRKFPQKNEKFSGSKWKFFRYKISKILWK
jgi:hypothetical protein